MCDDLICKSELIVYEWHVICSFSLWKKKKWIKSEMNRISRRQVHTIRPKVRSIYCVINVDFSERNFYLSSLFIIYYEDDLMKRHLMNEVSSYLVSLNWLDWTEYKMKRRLGMSCKTRFSWESKTNADYHDSSIADECSRGIENNKKRIQLKNNRRWTREVTCNNLAFF